MLRMEVGVQFLTGARICALRRDRNVVDYKNQHLLKNLQGQNINRQDAEAITNKAVPSTSVYMKGTFRCLRNPGVSHMEDLRRRKCHRWVQVITDKKET